MNKVLQASSLPKYTTVGEEMIKSSKPQPRDRYTYGECPNCGNPFTVDEIRNQRCTDYKWEKEMEEVHHG